MTSLNDTEDHWPELGKALEWLWQQQQQAVLVTTEWRVYHVGGVPTGCYAGPNWPDGNWLAITEKQALECTPVTHRIIDNRLINVDNQKQGMLQLVESESGEYVTTEYMSLILEPGETYERTKNYTRHSGP